MINWSSLNSKASLATKILQVAVVKNRKRKNMDYWHLHRQMGTAERVKQDKIYFRIWCLLTIFVGSLFLFVIMWLSTKQYRWKVGNNDNINVNVNP